MKHEPNQMCGGVKDPTDNIITNAEKTALVAALRSGEYKQGHHRLKSHALDQSTLYCCIAVQLCLRKITIPMEEGSDYYVDSGILGKDRAVMIDMNDNQQLSFEAIADWAEANMTTREQLKGASS